MKICWDNLEKLKYRPCRGEWQDKKHFLVYKEHCKTCNEPFLTIDGNFCSILCLNKNRKHSEETKRKISESLKGEKNYWYGKSSYNKDKKMSKTQKRKISESLKGPKNPNWKGGISTHSQLIRGSQEYKSWRWDIFKRDNFTCQECSKRGVEINAHHKKIFADYPEFRLDLNNGITLCVECHKEAHLC